MVGSAIKDVRPSWGPGKPIKDKPAKGGTKGEGKASGKGKGEEITVSPRDEAKGMVSDMITWSAKSREFAIKLGQLRISENLACELMEGSQQLEARFNSEHFNPKRETLKGFASKGALEKVRALLWTFPTSLTCE